jgi:ABC-type branched-subunit amino acid transport system ATPase component
VRTALASSWQRPAVRNLRWWAVVAGSSLVGLRLIDGPIGVVFWLAAVGLLAAVVVRFAAALRVMVPSNERVAAALVLAGSAFAGAYCLGAPILAAIERRQDKTWALFVLLVAAALTNLSREPAVNPSIRTTSSPSSALLDVRGLDFGYGKLQVLHGVDFSVREGEMVALLGVNGAGKSTLLRAISGLGRATGGSIAFAGDDITYLGVEARVRRGITQVPGGRAVFGGLSVVDNLRSYAYSLDRRNTTAAIDRVLATFPRLEERRNQSAELLSGGEQQMLALAKAVMLEPKLLLIDELSLGLAPVIVGQLLEIVRSINATGTAVVLVEQSVNIALNLAEHAYFMERGAVQFDGKSKDLLARDDLLRAVFLDGAKAR